MVVMGHVRNGMIVPDGSVELPEGAAVRIELVVETTGLATTKSERQGGWWRGQVAIADDFDILPVDMAEVLGMTAP